MNELAVRGGPRAVASGRAVAWPVMGEPERQAVLRVVDSGILNGPEAPETRALEREFAAFCGVRHALATNSGTAALHLAIEAAGIQPGDEVITSAFTYVASALAVLHHNAIPVFADIDPVTFNLDPARVAERITPRTRALLPVHIHGLPADMDAINALARRHGLVVIEDAAQAHGALYRGRKTGSLGDMAGFSFNATKNMPCGEGGIFVTDQERFVGAAKRLRLHGHEGELLPFDPTHPLDEEGSQEVTALGWMYLPSELPSAIARTQLRRLEGFNANAAANAARLTRRLSELPGLLPPVCPPDRTHVYHKYRLRLDPVALGLDVPPARLRDALLPALKAEGVECALWGDRPIPGLPLFRKRDGYGGGCPWTCHDSPVRYDEAEYPRTRELIDGSLVVGSQTFPLFPQPAALMDQYADAFEKILPRVKELIRPL